MADPKTKLRGKKVAILATDGVEESELVEPRATLAAAGATTVLVSPKRGTIQAFKHHDKSHELEVDLDLGRADPAEFDALLLPGGALNPDALRMNQKAVAFVKAFSDTGKCIAAICHGPWLLVEAGIVKGRRVTSWPSIRTDLENAGASWVDQEVVVDAGLITSRKPDDIPAFARAAIEEFSMSTPKPKQELPVPQQGTPHPETGKPGKLGAPPPLRPTKSSDSNPDARSGRDLDGNAQQVPAPPAPRRPSPSPR